MSRDIAFDDVRNGIDHFGRRATLITVNDAGAPHVVTALIDVGHERLTASVGSRTGQHLRDRPSVTLVWSPADEGEYLMILDGKAEHLDDPDERGVSMVSIVVTRGILHRLAGLPEGGSTCRAVGSLAPQRP